jgi:hypothetical protein
MRMWREGTPLDLDNLRREFLALGVRAHGGHGANSGVVQYVAY